MSLLEWSDRIWAAPLLQERPIREEFFPVKFNPSFDQTVLTER